MEKKTVFWYPFSYFGDAFCSAGSAHLKWKELGSNPNEPVLVNFWEPFKELTQYFSGVEWKNIDGKNKELYNIVNISSSSLDLSYYNYISRFLVFMNEDGSLRKDFNGINCAIEMNVLPLPFEDRKFVNVCLGAGTNGRIGKKTLVNMLERAKVFFPLSSYCYRIIGHYNVKLDGYESIISKYNIKDERTEDRTCHVIMKQIRESVLYLGVHTGLTYPSLGFNTWCWVQHSKNRKDDWCLNINNTSCFFYEYED